MIAAVIVWGIVQMYKYYREANGKHRPKPVEKPKPKKEEDLNGFLVGGLVLVFIGFAFSAMDYSASGQLFSEPGLVFTSFITGGIGIALLISFVVLSLMQKRIARLESSHKRTRK